MSINETSVNQFVRADLASHRSDEESTDGTTQVLNDNDSSNRTFTNNEKKGGSSWVQTVAAVIGNILEWYDFAVFGALTDIISQDFFPSSGNGWALVETWAIFAGSFLIRPVGGAILGWVGDSQGRRKALFISISMMAISTFIMGILPSYKQAGFWAIALLVLVRLAQGFSVGGELPSSVVFLCENRSPQYWGYYGSLSVGSAYAGNLAGSIVSMIMRSQLSNKQLIAWGWRIPFLAGSLVGLIGIWLRSTISDEKSLSLDASDDSTATEIDNNTEVPNDEQAEKDWRRNPFLSTFAIGNLRALIASLFVAVVFSTGLCLLFIWMPVYMLNLAPKPVPNAFGVNSGALLLSQVLFFPVAGLLSDRFGRRPLMTLGGVGLAVGSPFLMAVIGEGNSAGLAFVAQAALGIFLALWSAPMLAWLCESFVSEHRISAVGIAYNVPMATLGGSSPTIATIMVDKISPNAPSYFLSGIAVIGMIALWVIAPAMPKAPASSLPGYERVTWKTLPCCNKRVGNIQADQDTLEVTVPMGSSN